MFEGAGGAGRCLVVVLAAVMVVAVALVPAARAGAAPAAGTPMITWEPCGSYFTHVQVPPPIFDRLQSTCGRLGVPLSYDAPDGPNLQLAVMRVPARRPDLRIGTLVVNPGGPGGSGVTTMLELGALPAEVQDRFDLVGFDPRGMVRSEPIDCYPSGGPTPDDSSGTDAIWGIVHARIVSCASSFGWLLPHLGTNNVARDLDRLRAALGEERLNFLGFSYGTAIGATYARMFPERVRAFVLDGAVDTSTSFERLLSEQTVAGAEALFTRFAAACDAASATCPIAGRAASAWAALAAHATQKTLRVRVPDRVPLAPEVVRSGSMTLEFARSLAFDLLSDDRRWPSLAWSIAEGATGDATGFVEQALGGATAVLGRDPYLQDEGFVAVTCVDTHHRGSFAEVTAARRLLEASAPTFGDLFMSEPALACAFWPASTDPVLSGPVQTPSPVLVVGNTGDPNTPYPWAVALHGKLVGSALLTWDGVGHTAFASGRSTCVDQYVTRYLVDGTLPPAGTVCPGPGNPFLPAG